MLKHIARRLSAVAVTFLLFFSLSFGVMSVAQAASATTDLEQTKGYYAQKADDMSEVQAAPSVEVDSEAAEEAAEEAAKAEKKAAKKAAKEAKAAAKAEEKKVKEAAKAEAKKAKEAAKAEAKKAKEAAKAEKAKGAEKSTDVTESDS
ncbi:MULTISPECIES: hypothetical protein [Leptolyngbya]|uniref:Uncharacterized protein n=1 Tax=Leptolyngbya boryana CZ1 TaxID=3060204 RepID=A0AA96X258_LEPBY|nr:MULTISPECIES: hypothetical protein [Leptolyngbya]MBD1857111.1 hypothetical protein [Leptolyngbya sp. FACHB-1624]MBN8558921.1 hypothetical protein [Leptolyngbya sp. UWPOB_LEPTO1]MCY6488912.1 hypothetical protein [Leptolyngbya sp. GGD]WNZ48464.1 hypothetical protein Q2T42_11555 [Leptolyngbya boryana CZ1]